MIKLLKILAAFLLLLVVGAFLAVQLVDPNDFKGQVEARATAAIGREVRIDGDMRFLLLPRPGLEIRGVILGSALGVDGPPLAEVSLVRLVPRIRSLLQARVELNLVRLDGLRLHLIRDEQGRASWDLAAVPPAPATSVHVRLPQFLLAAARSRGFLDVSAADARPVRYGPVVHRIEIGDARLTWDDRQEGLWLALEDVELSAQPVALGESAALRMTAVARASEGGAPIGLRAEGNLLVDSSLRRLRMDAFELGLDGLGAGTRVDLALLLQTGLDADLAARRYLADELTLELHASGAALAGGSIDAEAGARMELDLDAETLKVTDLSVRSGTLSARGAALGQSLLSAPVLTGDLALDAFDLRAWLQLRSLPVPWTLDTETFRRVSLAACWRLEQGQLGLQDLLLGIDETHFSGEIEQIANGSTHYRFDLLADLLDLDRYMPPEERPHAGSGKTSQLRVPPGPPVASTVAFDHETAPVFAIPVGTPAVTPPVAATRRFRVVPRTLGDLGLDGRLRIGELKLAGLRFGDADLRVRAKDGRLELDDEVRRFYQGRLAGSLGLDLSGSEPTVTLAQRAAGIDIGPLLVDLTGTDSLTGHGELTADLAATGRGAAALRGSLAGDLAIHVTDGAVKGFSLERMIADARARLTGKPVPAGMSTQTDFKDLRASAEVRAGVLSNRDLVATADKLRITGKGTLDLVRERFDYRFAPMLVRPPDGGGIKELEGIPVPVHLTGSFARPRWDVDVAGALRAVAEREFRGQGGGLFKKLEERTGIKGLEQGLRGLFGR